MQLYLTFNVPCGYKINTQYYYQLQSAIYNKFKEVSNGELIHNIGENSRDMFKGFIFGNINGDYIITEDSIKFNSTLQFEFRSFDDSLCDMLVSSFENKPYLKLYDTDIVLQGIEKKNIIFDGNSIIFNTLSPVIVFNRGADKRAIYYEPSDEKFVELLTNNFKMKYKFTLNEDCENISITPIGEHTKTFVQYKRNPLMGYCGKYMISGESKYLDFLYNTGLGKRNTQGFGMLRIMDK